MLSCLIALAGPLVESFLEVGRGGTATARSRRPLAAFELRRVTAARFHSYTARRCADPASGDANASMKPSYSAQDHARGSERYHTIARVERGLDRVRARARTAPILRRLGPRWVIRVEGGRGRPSMHFRYSPES